MENPERVRGGKEAGGIEGQQGARDSGEEAKEKIQKGPTGHKKFEEDGRAGRSTSRRRARLYSGGIRVGGVRGESHSVTSGDTVVRAAPGVRAVKCSEFGEGKL